MLLGLQNIIEQWNAWGMDEPGKALLAGAMVFILAYFILLTALNFVSYFIVKKLGRQR